jgi:hypothetical protein
MDLLSVVQALLRNKRFAIPVVVLTILAALYVVKIQPQVYAASASVLLKNPQGPASASQIARDPSLKNVSPYNPFISYGDLDVTANAVLDLVNSPTSQAALSKSNVDPRYTLGLSSDADNPPIIDISGVGGTPQAAIKATNVLTDTVKADLYKIQLQQGINPFYMITAANLVTPNQAYSASGKSRSLLAIGIVGIIVLFIVISAVDAAAETRKKTRRRGGGEEQADRQANPNQEDRTFGSGDVKFTGRGVRERPQTPGYSRFHAAD